jgi:hypothetical protein
MQPNGVQGLGLVWTTSLSERPEAPMSGSLPRTSGFQDLPEDAEKIGSKIFEKICAAASVGMMGR